MKLFSSILNRLRASHTLNLGGLALLVGVGTGVGVWLFKATIELIRTLLFERLLLQLSPLGAWTVVLLPIAGGLVVAWMAGRFWAEEKIHGTANVIQAVALSGGRLRYRTAPLKALAAAVSIGSGASVGPEDPSVQIGASLGSFFGQMWRLSDERIRNLTAAGAAAAIAAAFNAPIAGVFFAIEIILGEIGGDALNMVLVAAVASSVLTQAVVGSAPAFAIPAYSFHSIWELPLYFVLGALAGVVAAFYIRLLYRLHDFFAAWHVPRLLKMASAGLVVGMVGIFLPQIFGTGYETIGQILNRNAFPLTFLLALLVAKMVLTPVSLGGGFVGGVFAPALFIGSTLGGAFGLLAARLFPGLGIAPAAFALVGMAALLAGAVHAPLTAILLLFEMTGDYHIILPLMFAVAVSLLISRRLQPDSVYALGLARHGIRLERGRVVDVLEALTVREVMQTDLIVLSESMPLDEAQETLNRSRRYGLPVLDARGDLIGILTLSDLDRALERGLQTVGEACTRDLVTTTPDESLAVALRHMSARDLGRLPVVDPANPRRLVGMLRRADVIRAYELALARRVAQDYHHSRARLNAFVPAQVQVSEVTVRPASAVAGRLLREIPFPAECLVVSLRRGRRVIVPNGETRLLPGDVLTLAAQGAALIRALEMCGEEVKSPAETGPGQ